MHQVDYKVLSERLSDKLGHHIEIKEDRSAHHSFLEAQFRDNKGHLQRLDFVILLETTLDIEHNEDSFDEFVDEVKGWIEANR